MTGRATHRRPPVAARCLAPVIVASAALATGVVGRASAHGAVSGRFQSPVPVGFVLVGAAATVAATAAALAWRGGVPDRPPRSVTVPLGSVVAPATAARVGFLALVVAVLVAGLTGRQEPSANLATVVVWPIWATGLALVAVAVGSPWRTLSPWRTVYDWLCRLEGDEIRLCPYPERLGSWPAVVGYLAVFGILANLTVIPQSPRATAGAVAVLAVVMLLGGLAFGPVWFDHADPFGALYGLLGRVAPVHLDDEGDRQRLVLRAPWVGPGRPVGDSALAALAVAAVYTVTADGLVETQLYRELLFAVRDVTGLGPSASIVLYLAGFAAFLLTFAAVAALVGTLGAIAPPGRAIAATLLPIAAAYEVAHSYPYALRNLGRLPETVGLHGVEPLAWLPLSLFWTSQVFLIVAGHLVAVVAAHVVVGRAASDRRRAALAHAPLVALMVGYTVVSLWVVSLPVQG